LSGTCARCSGSSASALARNCEPSPTHGPDRAAVALDRRPRWSSSVCVG
jgi:hypothetical protein